MADTRWLDDDEQRAWRAYVGSMALLFDQLDEDLQREAGIPHTYYLVLAMLSEAPEGSMRMTDLAERIFSSRSRLSHAVSRLEERGWVRRTACPTDQRGQLAVLTEAGLSTLRATAPRHVESVRRHLFDRLTPEQVSQLGDISEAVHGPLAASRGAAERDRRRRAKQAEG
jgi:DNA-binding MarR family transcriptional regulator